MAVVLGMRTKTQRQDVDRAIQNFLRRPRPLPLSCGVQHYDWGSITAIPALLGIENVHQRPYAELWIGAHHALPSKVSIDQVEISLETLIVKAPECVLGEREMRSFGAQLPFLLKILSARKPLSIQVHPNRQQAKQGFSREKAEGLGIRDRRRNYHDDNHKPELICALSEFYALRGFRPLDEIASLLQIVPELRDFAGQFSQHRQSLITLYANFMRLPQKEVDLILGPVIDRLGRENIKSPFGKDDMAYWVLRADKEFSSHGHIDRGIFSIFLLNLVRLQPGQAMFLPAGELHAYLEGTGVEVMANSNNVLRGGLTSKHIDVNELLSITRFNCGEPDVLRAKQHPLYSRMEYFDAPVDEFELSRLFIRDGESMEIEGSHGVQLVIVTQGMLTITADDDNAMRFAAGGAIMVPAGIPYKVSAATDTVAYWAGLPTT